jgi:hypothetical protein
MSRTIAFACFLGVLAALTPAVRAQPPVVKPNDRKTIVVPFELLDSGHMTIQVKLDGRGPFRVIFDTGAPAVMFSGKAAKECGLIPKDAKPFFLGTYTAPAKPTTVQVGEFKAAGIVPDVMDHPTVEALASVFGPLDGLVGFDLFGPEKLTIDYRAKTITVLPAAVAKPYDPAEMKNQMMAKLLGTGTKAESTTPGALWGFAVGKGDKDDKPGVDVTEVRTGSAADEAGLKAGDRLLVVSRRWTDSVDDVYRAAAFVWAGKAVKVSVRRGDKEVERTVKPRAGF